MSGETVRFDWLVAQGQSTHFPGPLAGDIEWVDYPIPPEIGAGGFHKIELPFDMTLARARHTFRPVSAGKLIPLAEVRLAFPEMTFQIQTVRGGRILHREHYPAANIHFSPGETLFRLSDRSELVPILDGTYDTDTTIFTIGLASMNRLIGEARTERLLSALKLSAPPSISVVPIPQHISAKLQGAMPAAFVDTARKLACQARVLEYLGALMNHVLGGSGRNPCLLAGNRRRAQAIHDQLINSEGRRPTLEALAIQHGCSASVLNKEFVAEYGKTIHAFIHSHRMSEAHEAILKSDVPLKILAHRLGYSHANHFNAAFRKMFGYPPGSLRLKR